jgi:pimeloyl-ACP methyl ester carboxylesterase
LRLPTPDGLGFTLSVDHHGFLWRPEEFGPLLFANDFVVQGLENQYHGYGLGVPLMDTRRTAAPAPPHAFYPKDVTFPVTALLRFTGTVADLHTQRAGRLELYNPLTIQEVEVQGRKVPLETDLTTPLAYFLSRSDLTDLAYEGFLKADRLQFRTGIYMFEPYQPGKIPVVMVHGLLSSPATWAPLFNDLRADPVLRERFQFWFYLYPTVNPYIATAADLRQTLAELRADLDPKHQDAALDQMVFVGHSMGGLVSKLLTTDSGDDFWRLVSSEPFDSLQAQPATRAELQRLFFFQAESCIRRVVLIATPHHGSSLSPSPPVRLLEHFIQLPRNLMNLAGDVTKENPGFHSNFIKSSLPTSLDLLAPGSPALEALAAKPRPPGVHYHSIIGVLPHTNRLLDALLPGGDSREGTDGIVPYSSAHLEGVDSELVVPVDHFNVHCQPLAVQEVRRILMEHLQSVVISQTR